jgi:hypothetical protein
MIGGLQKCVFQHLVVRPASIRVVRLGAHVSEEAPSR